MLNHMEQQPPQQQHVSETAAFLTTIANSTRISSSQQRILLARKVNEFKKIQARARTTQHRIKKLASQLKTLEAQKIILTKTIQELEAEINNGTDDEL